MSGFGDGTFRPDASVTRGQIAKMVVLAAMHSEGMQLVSPAVASFKDVTVGSTYYQYIETAYANGLLTGYSDGTFRPAANATRGQLEDNHAGFHTSEGSVPQRPAPSK